MKMPSYYPYDINLPLETNEKDKKIFSSDLMSSLKTSGIKTLI